jgi:cellulose biosynthesis protein BcsQ
MYESTFSSEDSIPLCTLGNGKRKLGLRKRKGRKRKEVPGRKKVCTDRIKRVFEKTRILSVFAHKGGVGKTSMSLQIAREALSHKKDLKILLIDLDPQQNTTHSCCRMKSSRMRFDDVIELVEKSKPTDECGPQKDVMSKLFRIVMTGSCSFTDCENVITTQEGRIDCLYGSFKLSSFLQELMRERSNGSFAVHSIAVKKLLRGLSVEYDFIICDLPPDLYELNKLVMRLSTEILLVMLPDVFANITTSMFKRKFWDDSYYYDDKVNTERPEILGFVMNRIQMKNAKMVNHHSQKIAEIIDLFNKLFPEVLNPFLSYVEDYGSTASSHYERSGEFIKDTVVLGSGFEKHNHIKDCYETIVAMIVNRLSVD